MERFEEIRKLYDIWDDSFGIPESEIFECEKRLGFKLPQIWREYYLQFGTNNQINQTQDNLILPAKIRVQKGEYFSFYQENQGNWQASIKLSESNLENPPVYYDLNEEEKIESQSIFLNGMALLQTIFAFPFNAYANDIENETEILIQTKWKLIMNFKTPSFNLRFFQNSPLEVLTLMDDGYQNLVNGITGKYLAIASKEKQRFREIVEKFDFNWEWNTLEDE